MGNYAGCYRKAKSLRETRASPDLANL